VPRGRLLTLRYPGDAAGSRQRGVSRSASALTRRSAAASCRGMHVVLRLLLIVTLGLAPLAAAAEPARILVFGDSLARGFGLPAGRGFVPALSRWLEAEGAEVRLVNAGLSGDTTFGGRV